MPDVRARNKVESGTKPAERQVTPAGILNLVIVYVLWGSTYLAIRVAVRPGAGIPPFTLGLVRISIAGIGCSISHLA